MLRLRICGAIPLFPHISSVWCIIKHGDEFIFMFVSYIYQAWDREKEDGVKEARVQSSYCELYCLDGSEKYPT